jgi:CBS domain-containing protein
MRIEQLMAKSPRTCRPEDTLGEAAQIMWDTDCGALPVTADDGSARLVGMITDRDICMAARFQEKSLAELQVRDALANDVRACKPGDSVAHAETIMAEGRVRRLPVVDDSGQVVGLVSLADLAREAARQHASEDPAITQAEIGAVLAIISEPRVGG